MDSEEIDISEFWCWNEDCPDYGKKGKGNIVPKEQYGKGICLAQAQLLPE